MRNETTIEIHAGAPRYPVLNAFMRSRARVSAIMGPLGSGKTFAALQLLLAHMVEQEPNDQGIRPTRFVAVRNVYAELFSTTVRDFVEVFDQLGTMKLGGLEPPTFYVECVLPDRTRVKSEVIFLARSGGCEYK